MINWAREPQSTKEVVEKGAPLTYVAAIAKGFEAREGRKLRLVVAATHGPPRSDQLWADPNPTSPLIISTGRNNNAEAAAEIKRHQQSKLQQKHCGSM